MNNVEIYNSASNTWAATTATHPRDACSIIATDSYVAFVGGTYYTLQQTAWIPTYTKNSATTLTITATKFGGVDETEASGSSSLLFSVAVVCSLLLASVL